MPLKTGLELYRGAATDRDDKGKPRVSNSKKEFEWGKVATKRPLILRKEASLESTQCGELPPGTLVQLLELCSLEDGTRRVRTHKGWCTSVSREGKQLLHGSVLPVRPDFSCLWPTGQLPGTPLTMRGAPPSPRFKTTPRRPSAVTDRGSADRTTPSAWAADRSDRIDLGSNNPGHPEPSADPARGPESQPSGVSEGRSLEVSFGKSVDESGREELGEEEPVGRSTAPAETVDLS